jgi:hypothetical protein
MAQVYKRVTQLMAGAALAATVMVGTVPVGAVDTARPAVADERTYCAGFDSHSLHRLYRAYFLRDPDATGLAYWQDILASGRLTLGGISQLFATSAEFTERYGNVSNRAFVELVYRNVMGREGDQAGIDWWTGLLDRGYSRGEIMVGFSDSVEFKQRTGMPPAPTANDPQVLPATDPFTVLPGATTAWYGDSGTVRSAAYWYPDDVSTADILRHTGNQLLCLGWTVRIDEMDAGEGEVLVSSENNLVISAVAFRQDVVVDPRTWETRRVNELVVSIRFRLPSDTWVPDVEPEPEPDE